MRAWLLYILIVIAGLAAMLSTAYGLPTASSAVFLEQLLPRTGGGER